MVSESVCHDAVGVNGMPVVADGFPVNRQQDVKDGENAEPAYF